MPESSPRTVRRPVTPATPAIHALLRHLEDAGFDGAPRVIGVDGDEEVLTFVEGVDSHHARDPELHGDRALAEVGRMLRRYHEAVRDFVPPAGARWRFQGDAPREGIVCHNDIAPVNTIFAAGRPRAFIDWEYAAPAPPAWDLACAAWSFVPLIDDGFRRKHGYPVADRGPRLRILCDAYGLEDRTGFLDLVRARQQALLDMVRRGAEDGDPALAAVWRETGGWQWRDAIDLLDRERDGWQRHLD